MMWNLYLFKRVLIKKINTTPIELLIKLGLDERKEALICERDEVLGTPTDSLINNILELTINDDKKLIEAAIRLYNDL